MKKKQNNNSSKLSDWTTLKLKKEAMVLDDLIYGENHCYGVKDMIMLDRILVELFERKAKWSRRLTFN